MTSKLSATWLAPLVLTFATVAIAQPTRRGGHDVIPYTHATVVQRCSGTNLPVLEIFFTQTALPASGVPAMPFLRVELAASPEEVIPPRTYALEPPPPPGKLASDVHAGRAVYLTSGQIPVWLKGTLAINSIVPGRYVNGHFRLEMPDGKIAESGFLARYLPGQPECAVDLER